MNNVLDYTPFQFSVRIANVAAEPWHWLMLNHYTLWKDYNAKSYRDGMIFSFKEKDVAVAFAIAVG